MLRRLLLPLALVLLLAAPAGATIPTRLRADSWAMVQARKQGTVTALWNGNDPFIFRAAKSGQLRGVEYDVMHSFVAYLWRRHGVRVRIDWREVPAFDELLPYVASTRQAGVFGWSSFSITPERPPPTPEA